MQWSSRSTGISARLSDQQLWTRMPLAKYSGHPWTVRLYTGTAAGMRLTHTTRHRTARLLLPFVHPERRTTGSAAAPFVISLLSPAGGRIAGPRAEAGLADRSSAECIPTLLARFLPGRALRPLPDATLPGNLSSLGRVCPLRGKPPRPGQHGQPLGRLSERLKAVCLRMFAWGETLQIVNAVVEGITIHVMDDSPLRYRPMNRFPQDAVQVVPTPRLEVLSTRIGWRVRISAIGDAFENDDIDPGSAVWFHTSIISE